MAVYTELSDEEMSGFVAGYDIGALVSAKGIVEGVENTNFLIHTEKGCYILTLYEKRVRPADLPFFLELMQFLADRGTPCPRPVPDRAGRMLGRVRDRPAAITGFLNGMCPRRVRAEHCAGVGEALAHLHLAGRGFTMTRKNGMGPETWPALYRQSADRAHEVAAELPGIITGELDFLARNWPGNLPVGVCHADLFPDNVFFIGDALSGLIDFYFACTDFLAYDIAVCLNAWCFERDRSFNITKARRLLHAYGAVRPLTAGEMTALPVLCRGAALRFLLTRLYDWLHCPADALVRPHDPLEYLAYLKFHCRVVQPGDYGLG